MISTAVAAGIGAVTAACAIEAIEHGNPGAAQVESGDAGISYKLHIYFLTLSHVQY